MLWQIREFNHAFRSTSPIDLARDFRVVWEGGERKLTPLPIRRSGSCNSLPVSAYATTSFTSMLPRVALEYGQTM